MKSPLILNFGPSPLSPAPSRLFLSRDPVYGDGDEGELLQARWTDGKESLWFTRPWSPVDAQDLAQGVSAFLAQGFPLKDALVGGLSTTPGSAAPGFPPLATAGSFEPAGPWPFSQEDLCWITGTDRAGRQRPQSPACPAEDLGFYLIVDSAAGLERLAPVGVKTFQLRVKNLTGFQLVEEIRRGVELSHRYGFRLFINDYWELALRWDAYGVHLGQEDLVSADVGAIAQGGLRLGVSTHCLHEVSRAHGVRPSYLACGPIFPTTLKKMPFAPQGVSRLAAWQKLLDYPLVAIGGITLENLPSILSCAVAGAAVVSAVMSDPHPEEKAAQFLASFPNPVSSGVTHD